MQDHLHWILARSHLEAFRTNLPGLIDEACVTDYHDIIDALEKAARTDLSSFKIDADRLAFRIVRSQAASRVHTPARIQCSNKRYCDRDFFCAQLERLVHFVSQLDN